MTPELLNHTLANIPRYVAVFVHVHTNEEYFYAEDIGSFVPMKELDIWKGACMPNFKGFHPYDITFLCYRSINGHNS